MKPSEALRAADNYILFRVIHPLAFKIDETWHVNPWRVAIFLLIASTVMATVDTAYVSMFLAALFIPLLALGRWFDIRILQRISDKYERDPAHFHMPHEWLRFTIPFMRIWNTVTGTFFLGIDGARYFQFFMGSHGAMAASIVIARAICSQWLLVIGIGYYFAACIYPPGKRKKKKVREWLGSLMPHGAIS